MKIGILQAGRSADALVGQHGDFDAMFERLLGGNNFDYEVYPVLDDIFPQNIDEADGWLISGSKFSVYEEFPWIAKLEDFVRSIMAARKPLVGICFGHQIIAQALGGRVEKFEGGWGAGIQEYSLEGFDQKLPLLVWHQDQVTEKPASATMLGTSDFCQYAALQYADNAISFQAHPEFTTEFVADLLEERRSSLPEDVAKHCGESLEQSPGTKQASELISQFFKQRI